MNINEAIKRVRDLAMDTYVLSEDVHRFTKEFHNGDDEQFWQLCKCVAAEGMVIVDNCSEDAYRIFNNIDHEGQDENANDVEVMISSINSFVEKYVRSKRGRLMKHGCIFGVLSK